MRVSDYMDFLKRDALRGLDQCRFNEVPPFSGQAYKVSLNHQVEGFVILHVVLSGDAAKYALLSGCKRLPWTKHDARLG